MILIVLPIAYLLFLAKVEIQRNQSIADNNQQILRLSQFAVKASSLVHELQKERGATAGFLGSNGTQFTTELPTQRSDTDKRMQELSNFLKEFDIRMFGPEFQKAVSDANDDLSKIKTIRPDVDSLTITPPKAIGAYTKTNNAFLKSISFLSKMSQNAELANMATAYGNFLQSKERAGIERAVLTNTFTQDSFAPGVFDRLKALITTQDNYINVFLSLANTRQIKFFEDTMQGKFIDSTNEMRNVAASKVQEGQFGIEPGHWFEMQTGKINLLKSVEDKLSADVEQKAESLANEAQSAFQRSAMMLAVTLIITAVFVVFIQRRITKPITNAVLFSNCIAEGNLDNEISHVGNDESGRLLHALDSMQTKLLENQNQMQKQMKVEREQAAANNRIRQALDNVSSNVIVADAQNKVIFINKSLTGAFTKFESAIQQEVPGFNASMLEGKHLDELIPGVSHSNRHLTSETSREFTVGGRIFNVIANNVADENGVTIGMVEEWVDLTEQRQAEKEVEQVINDAVRGKLSSRLDAQRFTGFMENLASGVNNLLDAIIGPLTVAADCMESISLGDIPELIREDYQGDFNKIKANLNTCINAINRLVDDANTLENAALAGKLNVRADAEVHQGDFKLIIAGFNNTLDALINPLNVAASCMESIANGEIPSQITEHYEGDFNKIKNNLNTCIGAINNLISDANMLSDAATQGEFETRADAEVHQGDFKKIIEGVNNTLDALISPLQVAAHSMESIAIGDIPQPIESKYRGGFESFIGNLNTCILAIQNIVDDAKTLAEGAQTGQLETRADDSQHQGDFKLIISSMNGALDAMKIPVDDCIRIMGNLSRGDLTEKMQMVYQGDFKLLSGAVNQSLVNLVSLIDTTSANAESVDNAAVEINSGILDLNTRTETQASSLEETAASMEQMTQSVKESAENAKEADQLVQVAQEKAQNGGEIVKKAVSSMDEISSSSQKISDIINVIDEIAFQTNLLALNAAVEAARAGDQGRGFAVVAGEVRGLAQRAASAAKEIAELINESVQKVELGSSLVNKSGETLVEIIEAVDGVSKMMSQIAMAANEQSNGISEVDKTIGQLDDMTQQNAALVEEASAASQNMSSQAQEMKSSMSIFTW